jgi:cell division protein FtsB
MKRNILLVLGLIVGLLLIVNSTKRLLTFRTTAQKVADAEARLEKTRTENKALKEELEYKESQEFREKEIRDKLGLAREGEAVVVLPKGEGGGQAAEGKPGKRNWEKWRDLFFGG